MKPWEKQVEEFRNKLLFESLAKCTPPQIEFFHRIFPTGVSERNWSNAMDLIARTIKKNEAGRPDTTL